MKRRARIKKHKKMSLLRKFKQFRLHHRILFYAVGSIGVIFVWRGVWAFIDNTPILNNPVTSLITGVGLTAAAGVFFEVI